MARAKGDFDRELEAAKKCAKTSDKKEPRADRARYDKRSDRIIVELRNGAAFSFPPELAQGLAGAAAEDLGNVRITPSGEGLRWPSLDVDFSLPGLMVGIFGSKAWMAEIGRRGGKAKSEAKRAAVRENGKKGGRPRRQKEEGSAQVP